MELAVSHARSFALSNLQYMPEAEQWLQELGCGQDRIVCVATYSMTEREPKFSSPSCDPSKKPHLFSFHLTLEAVTFALDLSFF